MIKTPCFYLTYKGYFKYFLPNKISLTTTQNDLLILPFHLKALIFLRIVHNAIATLKNPFLDDPLDLLVHPLLVLVHHVDLEHVGGGVIAASGRPPFRVHLRPLQLLHLFPPVLQVELDQVQDPLRVLAADHLHGHLEAFAHVDVHHVDS